VLGLVEERHARRARLVRDLRRGGERAPGRSPASYLGDDVSRSRSSPRRAPQRAAQGSGLGLGQTVERGQDRSDELLQAGVAAPRPGRGPTQ